MSRKNLSQVEARRLGEERESWCAVERQKEQDWCRRERQHNPDQFSSCVFKSSISHEPRCTFQVHAPTHKERKHFQQQYTCQWKA
ncbi:hypothetical protein SNE40_009108 [Patella caerulea]|uniref:Uncharacterized protein n=1 Tax=Patella caerulea TaxID=87958 RepID=A0AAN8PPP9_PATCE